MIEEPTDEVGITRRDATEKQNRQEPVIKGILPEPAPMPVPAAPKPEPVKAAAPVAALVAAPVAASGGFFGCR